MPYIMVTAKAIADALRERRVHAVRVMYDGEEIVLHNVSSAITHLNQGIVFTTPEGVLLEEAWDHEIAVTGWI